MSGGRADSAEVANRERLRRLALALDALRDAGVDVRSGRSLEVEARSLTNEPVGRSRREAAMAELETFVQEAAMRVVASDVDEVRPWLVAARKRREDTSACIAEVEAARRAYREGDYAAGMGAARRARETARTLRGWSK